MTGDDLKRLRERRGLDRDELADAINRALATNYNGETVRRWEGGREPAKKVTAFLDELALAGLADELAGDPPLEPADRPLDEPPAVDADTPPGPGPGPAQLPITSGRGVYVKACEELFELVATGVGMVGAATNNMALVNDGAVIAGDKAALGAAYGKLAETNDTFRRMLVGMTDGGAWLQVALVTGTTFSKCWQGHQHYNAQVRAARTGPPQEVPQDGRVERDHLSEAG